MTSVITVSNLAKSYMLYDSPRQRLWSLLLPGGAKLGKSFEALKPLSFTVKASETLGIIGRNGSGKSTLLQCLAGTLTPTQGEVSVAQPLSALLELGAGFNPDFTGRENVYLNGAILGLSREQMAAKIDEILDFANIGEFIDRPLSTYSSGMVVRLAFAVATAIEPKVLIVDEALSVGDEAFQRKCFRRIEQMREQGTSILFVSHSAQAVVQLCSRVIWLDAGEVIMDGDPKTVTEEYHRYMNAPVEKRAAIRAQILSGEKVDAVSLTELPSAREYPTHGGEIENLNITTVAGELVTSLAQGEIYQVSYMVRFDDPASDIRCGVTLKTRTGIEVSGATLSLSDHAIKRAMPGDKVAVTFRFTCHLALGVYFLNCGVRASVDGEDKYLHRMVDALALQVLAPKKRKGLNVGGLTDLEFAAAVEAV